MNTSSDLTTNRFILKPVQETDLENIYLGLSNPEVVKYYAVSFDTLEATKEQMAWYKNLVDTETGVWWTISSKVDGQFVGAVGLNDINKSRQTGELGFWLLPEFWRQGILTEVLPIVADYAFKNLPLARIEGFVETKNQACRAALLKLGFEYEGSEEDCEIKDGKPISIATYSLNSKS